MTKNGIEVACSGKCVRHQSARQDVARLCYYICMEYSRAISYLAS